MSETSVEKAYRLLAAGLDALDEATGPTATDDDLIAVLRMGEGVTRRMDRHAVGVVADLERRGTFTERGYRNSITALADLLGWDRSDARRRVIAAEQGCPELVWTARRYRRICRAPLRSSLPAARACAMLTSSPGCWPLPRLGGCRRRCGRVRKPRWPPMPASTPRASC